MNIIIILRFFDVKTGIVNVFTVRLSVGYCSLIGQLFLTREKQGNKYSLLSSAHPKLLPPSIASWSDCSEKN